MDAEFLRKVCLPLPGTTEQVQWGNDLVFKVGGKMYAVAPLEPAPVCLSFKCTPDDFADLTERPGIIPAPYLARAQWVALQDDDALTTAEVKKYVRRAYEEVRNKLPKKVQAALAGR
jgi:predicted DNA-binding protein (MmcQ/YjbR family)